jgi:uncharacterized protein
MRLDELIILTLNSRYEKMIAGRTLLQKTIYFLNEILKLQINFSLDINFRPHYYGPYSKDVSNSVDSLNAIGFIVEKIEVLQSFDFNITSEPRRYSYQLTEEGKEIAEYIRDKYPDESKNIEDTLEKMKELGAINDYKILSIAAKMYHILKIDGKEIGMTSDDIIEEAIALKWKISDQEAKDAIKFLKDMDLIKVRNPKTSISN